MILAFSVNNKQKKFFKKIDCKIDILDSKKILSFSIRSLKQLNKVNLSPAIELRIKDFYAKYDFYLPKFIVKTYYKIVAILSFMRYFSKIDNRYSKIIVWNGFMFRQHIALEIAKLYNIKPYFVESGFLPNRIVFDSKGVNFYNSVPRNKEFFINYQNNNPLPKELIPRTPKNAKKFENIEKKPLPKNYIFIPFQVDYDTQILIFSPWIKNMKELFFLIKEISEELKINFVFKEHPSSRKEYPHLHKIANNSKYISFANGYPTQELIKKSKAVITINSSVGIESLLFYKKVITLGDAFYNIDGIVQHTKNKQTLINIFKNLNSWTIDKSLIENFLKYLYYEYLIEGNFENFDNKKIKKVLECK